MALESGKLKGFMEVLDDDIFKVYIYILQEYQGDKSEIAKVLRNKIDDYVLYAVEDYSVVENNKDVVPYLKYMKLGCFIDDSHVLECDYDAEEIKNDSSIKTVIVRDRYTHVIVGIVAIEYENNQGNILSFQFIENNRPREGIVIAIINYLKQCHNEIKNIEYVKGIPYSIYSDEKEKNEIECFINAGFSVEAVEYYVADKQLIEE